MSTEATGQAAKSARKPQTDNQRGENAKQAPSKRMPANQYLRDWSYAIRHLEKGEPAQKIEQEIKEFRRDLKPEEAQKYAERTVEKAQNVLEYQKALKDSLPENNLPREDSDYARLDANLRKLSDEEFARRLYENGQDSLVVDALQEDRGYKAPEAVELAKQVQERFHAERDLTWAARQLERDTPAEKIIPKIAQYREGQVTDPEAYAKTVVEKAKVVVETEREIPTKDLVNTKMALAAHEYARDLKYAVQQLDTKHRDEVRLDTQERRPTKALDAPSYQMHGKPDHAYAVAIVQQAEGLRKLESEGRNLNEAIGVAQKEFLRNLGEAYVDRQHGDRRSEIVEKMSEGAPHKEFYARAVMNEVEKIRQDERETSIRPEMAREIVQQISAKAEVTKELAPTPAASPETPRPIAGER